MSEIQYTVIEDPQYGYKRLEPIPTGDELSSFYESQYYHLLKSGGRAPEIRKLMEDTPEGELELEWLQKTLYNDICHYIKKHGPRGKLLDVGCGIGRFVEYAGHAGFDAYGIELSDEAVSVAKSRRLNVEKERLDSVADRVNYSPEGKFDAVVLINVLEHVPKPEDMISQIRKVLNKDGLLFIRVPNDFNPIQLIATKSYQLKQWWVTIPDHVNYFNFDSLNRLLNQLGFTCVQQYSDFPIEMFLLMGDIYINNQDIGKLCHNKRVRLELQLDDEFRRKIYEKFAEIGFSRQCLMFYRMNDL